MSESVEAANEKRIRARAHQIWQEEGRPEGRELAHWRQAEAELAASAPEKGGAPKPRRSRAPANANRETSEQPAKPARTQRKTAAE